ncbi:YgdI/YgdR family lipoprotein [Serratia nematodiphila]
MTVSPKKVLCSGLFVIAAFSLTACASTYVISTGDGHLITAHGKPVTDKDTGLISYKDSDGYVHQIHRQDVKEIIKK